MAEALDPGSYQSAVAALMARAMTAGIRAVPMAGISVGGTSVGPARPRTAVATALPRLVTAAARVRAESGRQESTEGIHARL